MALRAALNKFIPSKSLTSLPLAASPQGGLAREALSNFHNSPSLALSPKRAYSTVLNNTPTTTVTTGNTIDGCRLGFVKARATFSSLSRAQHFCSFLFLEQNTTLVKIPTQSSKRKLATKMSLPRTFFDVAADGAPLGRIVFEVCFPPSFVFQSFQSF